MASERWNTTGESTFEHVRFSLNGVLQTLRFHEFHALPVNERVRILLEGKPSFWLEGAEVSRAKALARKL
ncbi:MAG: hypothetical protein MUF34_08190 [Polyangiaceae bacterium]|jgi:hypothetical protein|nr:hypothetical protein [Polyangiaceae bacterium]